MTIFKNIWNFLRPVVFNKYLYPQNLQGHFFSIIVIAVAAAEAAVGIAIIINIYRNFRSIDVENVDQMKN